MLIVIFLFQCLILGALLWFIAKWLEQYSPRVKAGKVTQERQIVLDSCTLIDGRIASLVATGFLSRELIVPKFVIEELQRLADGKDTHKRERARFGLDVVRQLQALPDCHVSLDELGSREIGTVDEKLVALAVKRNADLCTTDFNLNKVAKIRGVRVLNINELTHAIRPTILPGEEVDVKILQKGSSPGQGVGYADDGTMIVVDNAVKYLGRKITVKITKNHQTAAGKMLFGTLVRSSDSRASSSKGVLALRKRASSLR